MKNTLFLALFALGTATVCVSQNQAAPARQETTQQTPEFLTRTVPVLEDDSLRIITSMTQPQYQGGENIILNIDLRNTGTKDYSALVGNDEVDFFYDIQVTDAIGGKVDFSSHRDRRRHGMETNSWAVSPTKPKQATVWLNNLFEFRTGGKFQVVVAKKFLRGKALITISSEPVSFEIISKVPLGEWKN